MRDPENKYRPVKWLRLKMVSGYNDWKCICCQKVATDHHLFTPTHNSRLDYHKLHPGFYPDSEDEMYEEVYKQEAAEDQPSSASAWMKSARPAGAAQTERFKLAVLSRKPLVSGLGALVAGAAPTERSQPAALSRPAVSEPTSSGRASVAGTAPTERSQPAALSRPAVSEPTSSGRAREAGPAPTEVPATKAARMKMILDNSVKIQQLVREVNQLARQNAEQIVLLEADLK
jgi:hypothetical protein